MNWVRVRLRALALACGCVAAGACASQAPASEQAAPPDGTALFARACAKCHAADGSGGLPMVPNGPRPVNLRDRAWQASRSDLEITSAIRDGRGAMPPFSDVLTPDQIAALARHVRALGAQSK